MKVLMLVSSVDPDRGPDGFIIDWVRVLAGKVESLTVITYRQNPGEKLPTNVNVILIKGNSLLSRNIDLVKTVYLQAEKHDVIFSHILEVFGVIGGLIGKLTKRKTFFWYCQPYDVSKNYLAHFAFFLNQRILTCGADLRERYGRLIGNWALNKIISVGHGIYFPHYRLGKNSIWNNNNIKIVYAGRVSPIKDLPTLEKAIQILKEKGFKIRLIVESNFSYRNNPRIFKQANIFVNSSKGYSLDKTLLEALICNLVGIGSNNTYPFIEKHFPELSFKVGDAHNLAEKIEWILLHRSKAFKIARRAKKYVMNTYDLKPLMDRVVLAFKTNEIGG